MKRQNLKDEIWVAVMVWRGFPEQIKAFLTEKAALRQERIWQKQMNPDYDETGVFQIKLSEIGRTKPN